MANICDNTLYASASEETIEFIAKFLKDKFNAEVDVMGDILNAYFDSRWVFPEEEMEELFNKIPNKEDLYIRCLSVEYGCLYHTLWVCDENGWSSV